jgi:hypothetical protein
VTVADEHQGAATEVPQDRAKGLQALHAQDHVKGAKVEPVAAEDKVLMATSMSRVEQRLGLGR